MSSESSAKQIIAASIGDWSGFGHKFRFFYVFELNSILKFSPRGIIITRHSVNVSYTYFDFSFFKLFHLIST